MFKITPSTASRSNFLEFKQNILIALQGSDTTIRLGTAVLKNFDVYTDKNWYWIGTAAILGFAVLFNILFTFALAYLSRKSKHYLQ